MQSFNL